MKCPRCQQHNPPARGTCWNCGEPLESEAPGEARQGAPADVRVRRTPPEADDDNVSQLGVLGPLRAARGPHQVHGPVVSRVPPEHTRAAWRTRQLLVLGTLGGALTGGAALAIVFGVLAAAAADLLEASGISPGATLFVSIARGFIMGAIQGALVGALTTYYGGGMWTGAKVGAALAVGISLMQALASGALALVTLPMIVAALLLIGCAGGVIGALVGAAVGALAPSD